MKWISFQVAHLLAKQWKQFTHGELMKPRFIAAAEEMCPDNTNPFNTIILLSRTVTQKVNIGIGSNIN